MFQTGVGTFNQSGSFKNKTAASASGVAPENDRLYGSKYQCSDFMLNVQLLQHVLFAINIEFQ